MWRGPSAQYRAPQGHDTEPWARWSDPNSHRTAPGIQPTSPPRTSVGRSAHKHDREDQTRGRPDGDLLSGRSPTAHSAEPNGALNGRVLQPDFAGSLTPVRQFASVGGNFLPCTG